MKTVQLEDVSLAFAALGHPARLGIVRLLLAAHPDGLCVSDVQEELDIPGSTLTHHLDTLKSVGLITMERQGRHLIYRASTGDLASLVQFLFQECCTRSGAISAQECLPVCSSPQASKKRC